MRIQKACFLFKLYCPVFNVLWIAVGVPHLDAVTRVSDTSVLISALMLAVIASMSSTDFEDIMTTRARFASPDTEWMQGTLSWIAFDPHEDGTLVNPYFLGYHFCAGAEGLFSYNRTCVAGLSCDRNESCLADLGLVDTILFTGRDGVVRTLREIGVLMQDKALHIAHIHIQEVATMAFCLLSSAVLCSVMLTLSLHLVFSKMSTDMWKTAWPWVFVLLSLNGFLISYGTYKCFEMLDAKKWLDPDLNWEMTGDTSLYGAPSVANSFHDYVYSTARYVQVFLAASFMCICFALTHCNYVTRQFALTHCNPVTRQVVRRSLEIHEVRSNDASMRDGILKEVKDWTAQEVATWIWSLPDSTIDPGCKQCILDMAITGKSLLRFTFDDLKEIGCSIVQRRLFLDVLQDVSSWCSLGRAFLCVEDLEGLSSKSSADVQAYEK